MFWSDLFILACIYLDIYLVLLLLSISLKPLRNPFGLIAVPIAFFIVSGMVYWPTVLY
jgi:hypothetical protein